MDLDKIYCSCLPTITEREKTFFFHYMDEDLQCFLSTVLCGASYGQLLLLISEVESQKMCIRHVMIWKFKRGNSAKVTAETIYSIYGKGLITYRAVKNLL